MDLLKLIKEKANYFSVSKDDVGVMNVVTHIEVAEKHFEGGKAGEEYLFNDVIYRSNQAFEGVLKEAYRIIEGKNPNELTTYKIEKYFEENNILKERVLQLFTNYRTEWRNKSTHDYKLYFTEQEAFLAVISISAFVNILLDQMIEKRSFVKESINIKAGKISEITVPNSVNLANKISDLLVGFSKEVPKLLKGSAVPRIMEAELMGALNAFFDSYASDISLNSEYEIKYGTQRGYADLYLKKDNEEVIVEVKGSQSSSTLKNGTEQVFNYLLLSGINNGILYIPPLRGNGEMQISSIERDHGDKHYKVIRVYPRSIKDKE